MKIGVEGIKFLLISASYSGHGFAVDGFGGTKGGAGEVDLGFVGTDMVDGFMRKDVEWWWLWMGHGCGLGLGCKDGRCKVLMPRELKGASVFFKN